MHSNTPTSYTTYMFKFLSPNLQAIRTLNYFTLPWAVLISLAQRLNTFDRVENVPDSAKKNTMWSTIDAGRF